MKTILTVTAVLALLGSAGRADDTNNSTASAASAPVNTNATEAAKGDVVTPALHDAGYADGRFAAGLVIGEPTGISLKYWLTDKLAVDGALGWSFYRETDFHIQSDLLWHRFDMFHVSGGELPFYLGVGARVKFRERADDLVGIRVPVGVSYLFNDVPVDVFFEVAPIIDVSPSVRGGFTVGVGARYRF